MNIPLEYLDAPEMKSTLLAAIGIQRAIYEQARIQHPSLPAVDFASYMQGIDQGSLTQAEMAAFDAQDAAFTQAWKALA